MEAKTKAELYELAKSKKIPNRSKMSKAELITALMAQMRVAQPKSKSKSTTSKTSSVTNDLLTFEFDFDAVMFDDTQPKVKEASRAEVLEAAARWYESFAEEHAEVEETPLEVFKFVKPNTIRIQFSNIEDKHKSTMVHVVMDPDEDGNHPLKVKGKLYTVTAVSNPRIFKR